MVLTSFSDKTLSLAIIMSAAAWGLYWIPLRMIEKTGVPGSWAIVLLNASPLLLLLPLMIITFEKQNKNWKPSFVGGLMIGLAFTFYANGLLETTVIRATLLFYLSPVWTTIIGVIWLSEKLTQARVLSIVVAILGLFFLLIINDSNANQEFNIGDIFSLLSGVFWAFGAATLKKWPRTSTLQLTTTVYISTTIFSLIFAIFLYGDLFPSLNLLHINLIKSLFWSIIILLPSFWLVFRISKILFPGRVAILMMSEVVVAIISAKLLIPNETMMLIQWFGATLIIFAGFVEIIFGGKSN